MLTGPCHARELILVGWAGLAGLGFVGRWVWLAEWVGLPQDLQGEPWPESMMIWCSLARA